MPVDYKLFQVADLMSTMHLIELKLEGDGLSKEKEVSKSALLEWGKYDG